MSLVADAQGLRRVEELEVAHWTLYDHKTAECLAETRLTWGQHLNPINYHATLT